MYYMPHKSHHIKCVTCVKTQILPIKTAGPTGPAGHFALRTVSKYHIPGLVYDMKSVAALKIEFIAPIPEQTGTPTIHTTLICAS